MKNIFVSDIDLLQSKEVAILLQLLYANQASVYYGDPEMEAIFSADSFETARIELVYRFDMFFVAARTMLERLDTPSYLKSEFGTEHAKVITIASVPEYLAAVRDANCGVDFFFNKWELVGASSLAEMPDTERQTLLNYLTQ